MKKRILFVDDETMVLQGLQRMLRPMRQEWDMDFAESGAKALKMIDESVYDVIVTDMIMSGMDGAQLLKAVQEKSPKTIRLVLSGHAEQHLAIKCVGIAHQYLSKPCDPETLRKTLLRLTSLKFTFQNEAIRQLLPRLERLPSLPAIYTDIVRILNDPQVSMKEVGELIAQDIAITAQILKVVNSSFFGIPRAVSDPMEAAAHLGVDTVKALVLAASVFAQFEAKAGRQFSIGALCLHSQQVGSAARIIAQTETADRSIANDALVAGFLHDTGKLVLVANFPELFQQIPALIRDKHMNELEAELELFGTTHAQIGGYLLGLWGLPPSVVEAISLHHTPADSPIKAFSALTAVHVADSLIWERMGELVGSSRPELDQNYISTLAMTDRLPVWSDAVNKSFAASESNIPPTEATP